MASNQFTLGLKAGMSIAIGYFPVALTFGLLAKTAGLSIFETTAMSIFVYAGAAQYMALSLIVLAVNPLLIVFNTFVVNIRHLLMTASLNEKMHPDKKWIKAIVAFGITDESFSVLATSVKGKISSAFALGVNLIAYGSWVLFTAFGHIIGANLPDFLKAAMSIALYAMFIGLLVPSMKGNRKVVLLAAIAAIIHFILFITETLTTGWALLVATLVSAILVEILYTKRRKTSEKMYSKKEEV